MTNNLVEVPLGCTDISVIEEAVETLEQQRRFIQQASNTLFAVYFDKFEYEGGYWVENGPLTNDIEQATYFSWLEQSDHLLELMTEISMTKGASFKIVCVKPIQ